MPHDLPVAKGPVVVAEELVVVVPAKELAPWAVVRVLAVKVVVHHLDKYFLLFL